MCSVLYGPPRKRDATSQGVNPFNKGYANDANANDANAKNAPS